MTEHEWPSYEEALKEVAHRRSIVAQFLIPITKPTHPNISLDPVIQSKVRMACNLMLSIGRGPGDMPVDQTIPYRVLPEFLLKFLEQQLRIPARRNFAPFDGDYVAIFKGGETLINSKSAGRFYSHLVHILIIEAQLVLTHQYFYGLELHNDRPPLSVFGEFFSDEEMLGFRLGALSKLDITDLHGRIFLEYYAIMIRAQWDKLIGLLCMALDLKSNWQSIFDGIGAVEQAADQLSHPGTKQHLKNLLLLARDRLKENGWLRPFRDSLLHRTGLHSEGIIAQKNSTETTAQLWKKAKVEHDFWREAMMLAIIVCSTLKAK